MKAGRYRPLLMMFLVAGSMTIGAKIHTELFGTTVTMQTFFLCLTAMYFKPTEVLLGQILYLVTGFWAPVFASDYLANVVLLGSSAGYLYAFPIAAWVLAKYGKSDEWFTQFSWTVMAHFIILLAGYHWLLLYAEMDRDMAFIAGFLSLLPGAITKGGLATVFVQIGNRLFRKSKNEA